MSRRRRAIGFAAAAALCAALAASAVGGYRSEVEAQLGELRPALVTTRALPARQTIEPKRLESVVEVRKVPERFLSPGTLSAPEQLAGRRPLAAIPAGSYVLASQLRVMEAAAGGGEPALDPGTQPVEIAVDGAAALGGALSPGRRVDVVVTTEPGAGGAGRTYVAAENVALLGLAASAGGDVAEDVVPGPSLDSQIATLALTRGQALRLIQAESFARSLRLIAH